MPKPAKTRTCIACRENFDKADLLRFVVDPNNDIMLDVYAKAPARGSYVCSNQACLEKAIGKSVIAKMLKANKTENLIETVRKSLFSKISGDLQMLKKAQLFVPGADQVTGLLCANKAIFVLFAEDISMSSKSKIEYVLEQSSADSVTLLKKQQLSELMGIANCSVLAFKRSKLTTSLKNTLQIYEKLQKIQ